MVSRIRSRRMCPGRRWRRDCSPSVTAPSAVTEVVEGAGVGMTGIAGAAAAAGDRSQPWRPQPRRTAAASAAAEPSRFDVAGGAGVVPGHAGGAQPCRGVRPRPSGPPAPPAPADDDRDSNSGWSRRTGRCRFASRSSGSTPGGDSDRLALRLSARPAASGGGRRVARECLGKLPIPTGRSAGTAAGHR
jgi:hypothetical protein